MRLIIEDEQPQIKEMQIVPQAGEIFKPLHSIAENDLFPLNIFAIPRGRNVGQSRHR